MENSIFESIKVGLTEAIAHANKDMTVAKLHPPKSIDIDEAAWDAQIERDAAVGKLDALAAQALADYSNGKAIEL